MIARRLRGARRDYVTQAAALGVAPAAAVRLHRRIGTAARAVASGRISAEQARAIVDAAVRAAMPAGVA